MNIHVFRSRGLKADVSRNVANILAAHEGPMRFASQDRAANLEGDILTWDQIFGACNQLREQCQIPRDDFIILLTARPNDANWFSSPDPSGQRSAFIHAGDWENYLVDCSMESALAYQAIENILQSMTFRSIQEGVSAAHDPPIGCMNDMCSWKADVTFKLRTADICGDCLNLMGERGVSRELVSQALRILESLRKELLLSRRFQRPEPNEDKLPFSVAITRRKLSTTTEPLRKFLMLLDHFDSLIRTSVVLVGSAILRERLTEFFKEHLLNNRPSLGHWVTALQALIGRAESAALGFTDLPHDLRSRLQTVVQEANKAEIVALRNEKRGHGYCECHDEGYKGAYGEYSPIVTRIEKVLEPALIRLKSHHVLSTQRIDSKRFQVRSRLLMGSHPDFVESSLTYDPHELENIPLTGKAYVYSEVDQRWTILDPYLLFQECPICKHNRVLIWDGVQYLDPYVGHRVEVRH